MHWGTSRKNNWKKKPTQSYRKIWYYMHAKMKLKWVTLKINEGLQDKRTRIISYNR